MWPVLPVLVPWLLVRLFFPFSLMNAIRLCSCNRWSHLLAWTSKWGRCQCGRTQAKMRRLFSVASILALNEMHEIKGHHKNWKCTWLVSHWCQQSSQQGNPRLLSSTFSDHPKIMRSCPSPRWNIRHTKVHRIWQRHPCCHQRWPLQTTCRPM